MTDSDGTTHKAGPSRKPAISGEALIARREEVLTLRNRGVPWQTIADQLGYDSAASAAHDLRRALDQRREELKLSLDQYREKQLAAIDDRRRAITAVLEAKHYVVQGGEIIAGPEGEWLQDDAAVLRAVEQLRKEDEREARLLGLDAPVDMRQETTVRYSIVGVDPADLT